MKKKLIIAVALMIAGGGLALNVAHSRAGRESSGPICCSTIWSLRDAKLSKCASTSHPGLRFPAHSHPGEEIAYVIEGVLEYRLEGRPPVTLKAGESLFIPAGTVHSAKNVGSSNAAELATYIVEKGKPLVQIVK